MPHAVFSLAYSFYLLLLQFQFCATEFLNDEFSVNTNSTIVNSKVIANLRDASLLQCVSDCSTNRYCLAATYDRETRSCYLDSSGRVEHGTYTTVVLSKKCKLRFIIGIVTS